MVDRIDKKEVVRRLAKRMKTDDTTAESWLDAFTDTLFEAFREGSGVTLPGFGGFYLECKRDGCAFKFNPAQRLSTTVSQKCYNSE